MRHIVMTLIIVVAVVEIGSLRNADAFLSMSPSLLPLVILATALPPLIATFIWPPRAVLVTAIVVLLLTLGALPLSQRWADIAPTVGLLLVADALAVILARLRQWAIRRAEERAGLAEIRQALGERREVAAFAEVVAWSGRRVMGPGTLRLWVLDRPREELRLVRGDYSRISHGPDAETLRTIPDLLPLDAPDPRAQAVRLGQPAEGFTGEELGRDAETPLDPRLRRGDAVYVGIGLGGSFSILRALFGDRFLGGSERNAVLAAPVQWRGGTVGVIAYERGARPSERFTADERSRLTAIAALCAAAIDLQQTRPVETA